MRTASSAADTPPTRLPAWKESGVAFKMPMTRGVSRSNRWPRRMKWERLTAQRCNAEAGEGTGKVLWEKTGKEDGQSCECTPLGWTLQA